MLQQERPPVPDPARDNDVRAIYSWLVNGRDKLYLIAPETYQTDYPNERCLLIPKEHLADFREIRADFDRRKNTTRKVPTSLETPRPYVILDPNVAKEIIWKSPALSDSPIVRERYPGAEHILLFSDVFFNRKRNVARYPGAEHILLFSDVFFNRKRNVALVQIDRWCGGLCGVSQWISFEKGKDGVWQMRSWAQCVAVA
jgi:hypothetical protein